MTVKEYLQQAYRLDRRIPTHIDDIQRLWDMASALSSPALDGRVQSSRKDGAPFVRHIEKITRLEDKVNAEIDLLFALKEQIYEVISAVEDADENMVLQYRYIQGKSWESIAALMSVHVSTAYRWHTQALEHVKMPEDPIVI